MLFDQIDLSGTALVSETGAPLAMSAEGAAHVRQRREADAEIQNALLDNMKRFLAEGADPSLRFVGFVFIEDRALNVTNMEERAVVRPLVQRIASRWEEPADDARLGRHMVRFLTEVESRQTALAGRLGLIALVTGGPDRVLWFTNMQNRDYARALVQQIARLWAEQDAASTDSGAATNG